MKQRLLVCTDLDRTLIPNGPQPESPLARERFAALVAHEQVRLAYVSGRHSKLVEEAMTEYRLPVPDFVIGDVGTTIYRIDFGHRWHRDEAWEKEISTDWAGYAHAGLAGLLADIPGLRLQEREKQNHCKLSYYVPPHLDSTELCGLVDRRLREAGASCRLIWSIDEAADVGLLDVLPQRASKYHAIAALIRKDGFELDQAVFCGDSGNDIEVLISPVPSVLVGNSSDEVRAQAIREATEAGQLDRLYIACGGLMGMNGNYAGGILEGIAHYHPDAIDWMQLPEARG